ncbi:MAG: tetratricopeptide repeat protein, partial [Geminicoccales bacterium]
GDPAAAVQLFDRAVSVAPYDIEARLRLSVTLAELGRFAEARQQVEEALDIEPLHGPANYLEARLLEQEGQEKLAIGHYRAAANADSGDLRSRTRLAMLLMRQGDFAGAERRLREVIGAQSLSADAHYYLGLAAIARGECSRGIEALESSSRLSPHDPRVQQALSRTYASCPAATEEQRRESLLSAERLYERYPGRHSSATLAMAMAANDKFEDAIDMQTRAIFEAIRAEDAQAQREMYLDLQRYQNGEPAARAWPEGSAIFSPPLSRAWAAGGQTADMAVAGN